MPRPFFISAFVWSLCIGPCLAIDFSREIRPILSENCFFCHGPDEKKREAGLRLDDETAAKSSNDGVIAVVPGDPEKSALIQRIVATDPDEIMPPPKQHKTLSPAQIALLKQWIQEGAKWGKHWSYEKVVRPPVPAAAGANGNPIDAFLTARLKKEGLSYSPQADASTLIRRVALDLTGLPPSLEELQTFSRGEPMSSETYEKLVDHYLAKPAFGEHWAREWLDLARYADSAGYPSDPGREIWSYRDWVIRALNTNMPFDQFTIEQLAGDLLPQPTDDQLIATAFHRNTMTQNEGGTNDEEFRIAAVVDRVNTTFAVWMGTTMACAQCHTHKYDPLTHEEYFKAYAFLNQSADADKKDESPLHAFYTPDLKQKRQTLETELAAVEAQLVKPKPEWLVGLNAWESGLARDLAWQTPKPTQVITHSQQGAVIEKDQKVTIPKPAVTDTYTLTFPAAGPKLSAVRLETFPTPGFSNFVLSELKVEIVPPNTQQAPKARYVRIELPGKDKLLQLAEVEVFSAGKNAAPQGKARQSSTYSDASARRANDGGTNGDYAKSSVAHTSGKERDPWWEVDLTHAQAIDRVVVWNRTDGDTGKRLEGFRVVLLDDRRQTVWLSEGNAAPEKNQSFEVTGPVPVTFITAMADHEQTGFPATSLLKPKSAKNEGWAIAGAADQPHTLTLLTATPMTVPEGSQWRVTLGQNSKYPKHTLGAFRLSFTGDPRVQKVTQVPAAVIAALTQPQGKRSPAQQQSIVDHYVRHIAPETAKMRQRSAAVTKELAALKPITVPIMKDLAGAERRKTHIQLRGNWQDLGQEVTEGTPAVFPPLPEGAPRNRLTLARWIVSRDNPLTARVTVNRFWESLFGVGIVRTSEEFGSQGDLPFHPELLDWLAAEFMDTNWDVKRMIKKLVTTQAYRQDSRSTPELNERDPDNRMLAHGPRFRPTGELLRDQALAVSGLLHPPLFGKPVRPLRPNLGLTTAFGGTNDWVTSEGPDKHRRSVYTEVKRNSPYPSFTTFDASNREVCTIRRGRTNTPLQAFVTLNDPVFIEANQALARRVIGKPDPLVEMFRLCLSRAPTEHETRTLKQLEEESLATYRQDPENALKMATDPLGPAAPGADLAQLAAWTTVANVVMNLDEFLMRR